MYVASYSSMRGYIIALGALIHFLGLFLMVFWTIILALGYILFSYS